MGSSENPRPARGELVLLLGIVVLIVTAFLLSAVGFTVAGVSMLAWALWFTMCAAPVGGLILAIRSKED